MTTTPEQARQIREMAEFTDPSVIIASLVAQLKNEADSHEAWQNEHLLEDGARCRKIRELEAERDAAVNAGHIAVEMCGKLITERDAALFASRYETDLCGQALADLKIITAERDGLAAAIRQTLDENGHLADGDVCTLKALKDALAADGAKTCAWTLDDDGYYGTACGEVFVFSDGTPAENNAVYCHHCSGKIEVQP